MGVRADALLMCFLRKLMSQGKAQRPLTSNILDAASK
jgi:hypothetical protein